MKSRIRIFIEAVILILCTVATVATSKDTGAGVVAATYGMATNCSGSPVTQEVIEVLAGMVTSPAGRTFASYGLPVETLSIGTQTITGTKNGVTRVCEYSKSANNNYSGAVMHVYTCSDNGVSSCAVSFTVR